MPGDYSYHQAQVSIEDGPALFEQRQGDDRAYHWQWEPGDPQFATDERWVEVARCSCGYQFQTEDAFQVFTELVYRRHDTGEEATLRDAPPGAMWDGWWLPESYREPDGLALVVKCPPNHDWITTMGASNCNREDPHRCWVRRGTPPHEPVTIDKGAPGESCTAGGGSIWIDMPNGWHGFLTNGWLLAVGEAVPG